MLNRKSEWYFSLDDVELLELKNITAFICRTFSLDQCDKFIDLEFLDHFDDFKIINLKNKLNLLNQIIHYGIGFCVLNSFTLHNWSTLEVSVAILIIGKCLGNLRQQNIFGHVLGHVQDLGLSSSDPKVRVYQTNERQTFHTDSCDVVGLLCLKTAKTGGLSSLVSSGAIFNEMKKTDETLAHELFNLFPIDKRGDIKDGYKPYFTIPIYSYHEGYLTAIYQRQYIDSTQRFEDAPKLTPTQLAALNLFDTLADDPTLNFTFQLNPGEILFVNNYSLLHDRTAFIDHDEKELKRHLLRIWISTQISRPLPQIFGERFGSIAIGDRGGVGNSGVKSIATLNTEL
jgi:hypothetical protein